MSKLKYLPLLLTLLSPFAVAEEPAPSEESIKQLLTVVEARKLVDTMLTQMDMMMRNAMQRSLQGRKLTPAMQKIIERMENKTLVVMKQEVNWNVLEPLYVKVYRDVFTQADVDGMLAFYKTPAGQAFIKKQPQIALKTREELQQRMGPLIQKLKKIQIETTTEIIHEAADELAAQAQKQ